MRAIWAIVAYVLAYFALAKLWGAAIYWQHEIIGKPPTFERIIVPGLIFPLVLGFVCAIILRPNSLKNYWPFVVAPLLVTAIRLFRDDVSIDWLAHNIVWLLVVGDGSIILFSIFGAWLYSKFILR